MPTTTTSTTSTTARTVRATGSRLSALALAGLVGLAAPVVLAGPATAHDRLESTDPAADSVLDVAPDSITLTMSSTPLALGTRVQVTAPDSSVVSTGEPQIVDETITQPLTGARPAGTYQVQWRVTSSDGHPIDGTFSFTTDGAVGTPTTEAPTTEAPAASSAASPDPATAVADSGNGTLIGIAAAVVVVLGGIGGLIGYRRRQR
ncbi:copper resistance CopC family protein [Kineococcus sp. SYSU DK003]|uniref:copper resistance CopC family protein n=1 Tax=Kineococcus sp. SYSU DK003 TaxID=3383124 RepID=UPI003D7E0371